MDNTINIRSIQHYMYCKRRYALLEVNDDWVENAFVVKANIMHENVHSGSHSFSSKAKIAKSSIAVYNDLPEYNIYGVIDCLELTQNKNGVYINSLNDSYDISIIEYKPKPPKTGEFHLTDAIQVFAQKICIDSILGCECKCYIYYSEVKKRVLLPFDIEYAKYDKMLTEYLKDMRNILKSNKIPDREKGQKCSGCSLSDVCFHKDRTYDVKALIFNERNNCV